MAFTATNTDAQKIALVKQTNSREHYNKVETMSYRVFARTWWKNNTSGNWPNNLEPCAGRKTTLQKRVATEQEARDFCKVWNANHKPGRLSRKAEYEEN